MTFLNKINDCEREIIDILKRMDVQADPGNWEDEELFDKKINDLVKNTPLGSLSNDFINKVSERSSFSFDWTLYKNLTRYIRTENNNEKLNIMNDLEKEIIETNKKVFERKKVLNLVETVYMSQNNDLINLFFKNLPIPPLSMFDLDHQPPILVNYELERNKAVSKFKENNVHDKELDSKIQYLQRRIRGTVRLDSEVERISQRHFTQDPDGKIKAEEMIQEANMPYLPKGCSRELSRRIIDSALKIKLYDSTSHLLAADKINIILDGALFGRNNLLSSFIDFRPAALKISDVNNGDGNVICMGPDKIDPQCLVGRTIGLELDLETLTKRDNPTMFFKQTDLGYNIGEQSIRINNKLLTIKHNGRLDHGSAKCANLQIIDGEEYYYSEIPKDLLISYNVKGMDKILILNFFRYLDNLRHWEDGKLASGKIKEIYDRIESLNDDELRLFLRNLGRKMSCTSEFNFSGAYKIDLNALKGITVYQEEHLLLRIEVNELIDELNNRNFEKLKILRDVNPEILKSSNFVEFLLSKVDSQEAKLALTTFITQGNPQNQ